MARFTLLQYDIKNVNNNPRNKRGDKNGKKGDEAKLEDKDNNNTCNTGAHVGETTTPQDSSTPSNGLSIGAHVYDVTKPDVWPAQSIQDILAAHPIDDSIWSHPNVCDISINTVNSTEALAGIHTGESTYTLHRPNPRFEDNELFVDTFVPPDSIEDNRMYQFMDSYNKWDKLLNTAGVDDIGSFYTFMTNNTSNSADKSIKSDFGIGERQS